MGSASIQRAPDAQLAIGDSDLRPPERARDKHILEPESWSKYPFRCCPSYRVFERRSQLVASSVYQRIGQGDDLVGERRGVGDHVDKPELEILIRDKQRSDQRSPERGYRRGSRRRELRRDGRRQRHIEIATSSGPRISGSTDELGTMLLPEKVRFIGALARRDERLFIRELSIGQLVRRRVAEVDLSIQEFRASQRGIRTWLVAIAETVQFANDRPETKISEPTDFRPRNSPLGVNRESNNSSRRDFPTPLRPNKIVTPDNGTVPVMPRSPESSTKKPFRRTAAFRPMTSRPSRAGSIRGGRTMDRPAAGRGSSGRARPSRSPSSWRRRP